MLKIRLQRVGRKNDPSFRVVTVDSRRGPKVGKHTEVLGSYDPKRDYIAIKGERVKYWISKGAQVSDTMHNLLVKESIIEGKKIHVAKGKKKVKKDISTEGGADTEEKKKEVAPEDEQAQTEEKSEDAPAEESQEKKEETKEPEVVEEPKEQETVEEKKEVV